MTPRSYRVAAVLAMTAVVSLDADRIRLRSGGTVEGMFIGGDSRTVRVLLADGTISEVKMENAVAIEFSPRTPKASPPAPPSPSRPARSTPTSSGRAPSTRATRCSPASRQQRARGS